jgi:hypothetical protein
MMIVLASMMLLSGCVKGTRISQTAICEGLDPLVLSHSEALVIDGGPQSVVTGARLIRAFDSGCDT